ncbi:hypothetical protein CERSUDRAFT_98851 [Gelatoporia subvermispora B]|uniref:Uncharacterized protein n=1 Tax=Ceriporiopsis subvermispora (strain B) TaxID=914234 RepID=M2R2X7_CERS8|nr:hypothetical protein CERSUDRAFT_98851 [Gelatoporia subvermispora B]
MSDEDRFKAYQEFRAERVAGLPDSLKPQKPPHSLALARQTPALPKLERILRAPYSFEPLPPRLHYGYPITVDRLQELALGLGYTPEVPMRSDLKAVAKVMNHIMGEVIEHPADLKLVYCEDKLVGIISLCTNWAPSARWKEIGPKLKEYLGEIEDPKWYLDMDHWYWRSDL